MKRMCIDFFAHRIHLNYLAPRFKLSKPCEIKNINAKKKFMKNIEHHIITIKEITPKTRPADASGIFQAFAHIRSANPYDGRPHDKIIQVKHIFEDIANGLIDLGVFSKKALHTIVTKEKTLKIIEELVGMPSISELGVLRSFYFSRSCALKISQETKNLIEVYPIKIMDIRGIEGGGEFCALQKIDLLILRRIYINLGKLQALYFYFEGKRQEEGGKKTAVGQDYLPEVKQILLDLLKKQAKTYKTVPKAIAGIEGEFREKYDHLQSSLNYKTHQKFFDADNLTRNINNWKRADPEFRMDLSEYIK